MNIIVDKLLTSYHLSGQGHLVLLLHGWGDSHQSFKGLQSELSKKYQVLSLDLPGFGGTESPKETWDLDNYGQFLSQLLKKLGLDQPYAVIGHSNGGALAIRSISLGQIKPQKLVLIAASGIRSGRSFKRLLLLIFAKAGNIATIWMPERYRKALRKSLYTAAGSDMLIAPHLAETFKNTVRQDVQADARKIQVPTLLIYASEDKSTPADFGRRYKSLIKDSKLEIIGQARHFVHQDQPDMVNSLIKEFLA